MTTDLTRLVTQLAQRPRHSRVDRADLTGRPGARSAGGGDREIVATRKEQPR